MAEKQFEQQAKELLKDFELPPSPAAWEKIKKEIEPEERRRRFVFWWLLPVLLAGGGLGYFNYSNNSQRSVVENTDAAITSTNNVNENNHPATTTEAKTNNLRKNNSNEFDQQGNSTLIAKKEKSSATYQKQTFIRKTVHQQSFTTATQISTSATSEIKNNVARGEHNANAQPEKIEEEPAIITEQITQAFKAQSEPATSQAKDTASATVAAPSITVKSKPKRQWQFGITVEGGITSRIEASTGKAMADAVGSPATGGFSSTTRVVSNYSNGNAFGFGAIAQKQLSRSVSFNVAALYRFNSYSSLQQVYKDSVSLANGFSSIRLYDSNATVKLQGINVYTGFNFRLLQMGNVNLQLGTGIDNHFLLLGKSSQSIQTVSAVSQTRQEKSNTSLINYNKWQPQLRTAFTVEMLWKNNAIIQLSPYFRYSLRQLENSNVPKNKLISFGLSASYLFGR